MSTTTTGRSMDELAANAYRELVRLAGGRATIRYGQLAELTGDPNGGQFPSHYLNRVAAYTLAITGLDITLLVVTKETGRPSSRSGYDPRTWDKDRESIYDYPWGNCPPYRDAGLQTDRR